MTTTVRSRFWAGLVAIGAFVLAVVGILAIAPYALGLLYGCVPPTGSCGDGVGWAMLLSAPITVPLGLGFAVVVAILAYQRTRSVLLRHDRSGEGKT